VLQENLESGRYAAPVLEHLWEVDNSVNHLMADVDGVFIPRGPPLSIRTFQYLIGMKDKYGRIANEIEKHDERINLSQDGSPFKRIVRCWQRVGLTEDDFKEACKVAGEEAPITSYTHEAIKILYDEPPFINLDFNSASFEDCLISFSQHKELPVSLIEGSWMEFHKNKLTGRYFFNYGINKLKSGNEMLTQLKCHPNLMIKKGEVKFATISDTKRPDIYFTNFVGMGGIALWMDESIQRGVQVHPTILEMNIPEGVNDMRIFTYPIKHVYRAEIVTRLGSAQELDVASLEGKKLIVRGQDCLKSTNQKIFDEKVKDFIISSQNVLILLSKFDFPRHSTGIDYMYVDLLSKENMKGKKEKICDILGVYTRNFPEALAKENWLTSLR